MPASALSFYVSLFVLPIIVVPAVVVVGAWRRDRAIIIASGGSLACYGVMWLLSGGQLTAIMQMGNGDLPKVLLATAGYLTFFTSWVLALHHATSQRRLRWLAGVTIAGMATITALNLPELALLSCAVSSGGIGRDFPRCAPPSPGAQLLATVCLFAGPLVALIYALRTQAPKGAEREHVKSAETTAEEAELRIERM